MGLGQVEVAEIPAWTYEGKSPSIFTFFESIALAGLEDKEIKVTATDQKKLLGYAVFGRRVITVHRDATVESVVDTGFGRDSDSATWPASTVRDAAAAKKQLRPGTTGPDYFSYS